MLLQPLEFFQQLAPLQLGAHLLTDGLVIAVQVLELQRIEDMKSLTG